MKNKTEKQKEAPLSSGEEKKETMSVSAEEAAKDIKAKGASLVEKAEQLGETKVEPEKALKFCEAADAYFIESVKKSAYRNPEKAEAAMLSACDKYSWMKPAVDRYKKHADAGGIHAFDPNVLAAEVAEEAYIKVGSHFLQQGTIGTYDNRGKDLVEFIYDEKKPENPGKAQGWFTEAKDVMQKGRAT